ncbi:MAG: hypothetical protein RL693_2265 [Verrucomicrobiota bacterium]|jgi:hypothetical protein
MSQRSKGLFMKFPFVRRSRLDSEASKLKDMAAKLKDMVAKSKKLTTKANSSAAEQKKALHLLQAELKELKQDCLPAEIKTPGDLDGYHPHACYGEGTLVQIEESWSDDFAVGMRGFVLVKSGVPQDMEIKLAGKPPLSLQWEDRADVLEHNVFAEYQKHVRCGFKALFGRRVFHEVNISFKSGEDERNRSFKLDATGYAPIPKTEPDGISLQDFAERVNLECKTVLEIGSRVVCPGSNSKRSLFAPHVKYTGFDIYPDANTDVVGDAHAMSQYFPEGTKFDAIFSGAVLEHTAMPWMIALEINKLLNVGGISFHCTPFTCPLHETPWDFWRFTHEGLRSLFSPALGFEVLSSGLSGPCRVHFQGHNPLQAQNPYHPTYMESNILVRKIRDFTPEDFRWNTSLSEVLPSDSAYPYRPMVVD